jgi:hypothetical protein
MPAPLLFVLGIDPFLFLGNEWPVAARTDDLFGILSRDNPEKDHVTVRTDEPDHLGARGSAGPGETPTPMDTSGKDSFFGTQKGRASLFVRITARRARENGQEGNARWPRRRSI